MSCRLFAETCLPCHDQTSNVGQKENDPCDGVRIHTIVLDASSINQLDASAIDMLILVAKSYAARGVSILCANWKGPQRDLLELSGFYDVIPPANLFLGLHDAVVEARKR